jgi:peptide/nickel transport system ATP-binding protein/oligopeptide transport system ATP-binding protein
MVSVRDLTIAYPRHGGRPVVVVDGVSFSIAEGKTLGLVGESGSGKTTIARAMMGLVPVTSGSIVFRGQELAGMSAREFLPLRKHIQMIFQDPYSSLNPRLTVLQTLSEPLEIHFPALTASQRRDRVVELLKLVGLHPDSLLRRPREFSGGQRQRIGIARALAVEPRLIVCDECVSALDVSIQAQIINLLQDLQEQLGLTYLFIGHDLAVVEHVSNDIAVLHHGKLVEYGPAQQVIQDPQNDYTKNLLAAVPVLG